MSKYSDLLRRAKESVEYWTQVAMRAFVGDALQRMDAQNISRADLASKLGVSPAYVTKILRGDVNFTLESLVKIAHAVGGRVQISIQDSEVAIGESWSQVVSPSSTQAAARATVVVSGSSRAEPANWHENVHAAANDCLWKQAA